MAKQINLKSISTTFKLHFVIQETSGIFKCFLNNIRNIQVRFETIYF